MGGVRPIMEFSIIFIFFNEGFPYLPSDMRAAPMAHVQSPWTARHVRERATWSVSAPRPPWMVTYHHHYHHHHHHHHHQDGGGQAGHQGEHRVRQRQVGDEQERQSPGGGLQ